MSVEPWGPTSAVDAEAAFAEQAGALAEAGVDLFILETFSDLNEIRLALRAVRRAGKGLPVQAQMTIEEDGNSLYGTTPEVFTRRLEEWGADVVGVNCSVGPAATLECIEKMAAVTSLPLSAMPNAGLPRQVDGRNIYLCSPDYMAEYAKRFILAGVKVVGGCCGTTPAHIKAMRGAIRALQPPRRSARGRPVSGRAGGPGSWDSQAGPLGIGEEARRRRIRHQHRDRPPEGLRCFEGAGGGPGARRTGSRRASTFRTGRGRAPA